MGVETFWLVEDRVILQRLYGEVTIDDLKESTRSGEALLNSSPEQVIYLLVDARAVTHYPKQLRELVSVFQDAKPDKVIWTLILSEETIVRFLGSAVTQMLGLRVRVFKEPAALYNFLHEHDEHFPAFELPAPKQE